MVDIFEKTEQLLEGTKTLHFTHNDTEYDVKILPNVGDTISYLKKTQELRQNGKPSDVIQFQFDFIVKLVKQGNPDKDEKVIKALVENNMGKLLIATLIALNIAEKKDFEDSQKN